MAKKKQTSDPDTRQLDEDSKRWRRKEGGVKGWYCDHTADMEILEGDGYVVLVSFEHDPVDDAEFWRKRFDTVEEAMEYAEKM